MSWGPEDASPQDIVGGKYGDKTKYKRIEIFMIWS